MFFAMRSSAIFPVVPYNVSLWSMIRYLCGFILHQVEIQHTNDLLGNILHKIIENFKLFLLLLREWNRLYGIESLFLESFTFWKDHLSEECYIYGLSYISAPVHSPPPPRRKGSVSCQQKSGLFGNNAISRPCNYQPMWDFTAISLSCLQNGSVPDVQSLCSLVGKNPSGVSFFLKSHMQLCG